MTDYYCRECFDFLCEAALPLIPDLKNLTDRRRQPKGSAAQRVGVLLGIREGVQDKSLDSSPVETDRRLTVPVDVLQGKRVFARFHLHGDELEAYKEELAAKRG